MSNGFIYVVAAHFIDKIEEEENILDPVGILWRHILVIYIKVISFHIDVLSGQF